MRLGEFLRCHRMRVEMTQRQLARKVGMSVIRLSQIERGFGGSPKGKILVGLATVLEVSLEHLIELAADHAANPRKKVE